MPVLAIFFFISLSSVTYAVDLGQERDGEVRLQTLEGLGEYGHQLFKKRQLSLQDPEDLIEKFAQSTDQDYYRAWLAKVPKRGQKLAALKQKGEWLEARVGPHTLRVPVMNMFTPKIELNGSVFHFSSSESYQQNFERLSLFMDQKLARKTGHWLSEMIVSPAYADENPYKAILMINASGVIYLTVSTLSFWRNDVEDLRALLTQVQDDLHQTQQSCEQLKQQVGVSEGAVPVFKMLNQATAQALNALTHNNHIDSRTLMRNAFARYAEADEHGKEEQGFISCENFLQSFLLNTVGSLRVQISDFCYQFKQTEACLSDLKSRHDQVQSRGRNGALKLYNGKRPYADDNQNALPYIAPPTQAR